MPRLADPRFAPDCTIEVDGRPLAARAGETIAVALLAAGRRVIARSAKYHRPRGAFCLAGSCHACLARVDGVPNQRTCLIACRPGLRVQSQNAFPTARNDLLGAIDAIYAHGLDHHHLAIWNRYANRAAVALARRLSGLGELADQPPPPSPTATEEYFDALVIGAGPAGLGAAEALARRGRRVLLAEADGKLGGSLRCALSQKGDPPLTLAGEVADGVAAAGGEAAPALTAVGLWMEQDRPLVAFRVETGVPRLRIVRAEHCVLATGTVALPPLFPRNDLPGIFASRGLARTLAEDGVVPGESALVLGQGLEARALTDRLSQAGMRARLEPCAAGALGKARLKAVVLAGGERVACDTLACAGPRAPASSLARLSGAAVQLDPASGGFRACVEKGGETGVPGVLAAGEVTGPMSAGEALERGRRAGETAARG